MQLRAFDSVYPSVVSGLNVVLPFFVLLVFTLVVFLLHYGGVNVAGRKVALRTPRDEEERQFQVHASLVLAAFLFLLLRLPDAVLQVGHGTGRDGTGRDGTGRDGTGRDGTGRDGTGRDGTGRDGTGRDGTGRDGTGRDGTGRDGTGRDGTDEALLLSSSSSSSLTSSSPLSS